MWPAAADSSPTLPVETMATSSVSSSERLECSVTEFGSPVKFTHFTMHTRPAAENAPDQGTMALGTPMWTPIRDFLRMCIPGEMIPPEAD